MVSFEVIPIIFLFIMIYLTFYSYKRRQISRYALSFWVLIWMIGIILVAFHSYFNQILDPLNIARVFDLYTILAFLLVLFVVFYLFRAVSRIEKKVENLARVMTNSQVNSKPTKSKKRDDEIR